MCETKFEVGQVGQRRFFDASEAIHPRWHVRTSSSEYCSWGDREVGGVRKLVFEASVGDNLRQRCCTKVQIDIILQKT